MNSTHIPRGGLGLAAVGLLALLLPLSTIDAQNIPPPARTHCNCPTVDGRWVAVPASGRDSCKAICCAGPSAGRGECRAGATTPAGPNPLPPGVQPTPPTAPPVSSQQKFEEDKQELLNTLKDIPPTSLGEPAGGVRDTGIKIIPPATGQRDVSTAWEQLHCASYLTQKATGARLRNDPPEASYLTEQAAQALSGGRLGVTCPPAPPVPTLTGDTPEARFYELLVKATRESTANLTAAAERIQTYTQAQQQAEQELGVRKAEKEALLAELKNLPDPQEKQKKKSRLAELEALIAEAEQLEREAAEELARAQAERQGAQSTLDRNRDLYQKAEAEPASIPQLLQELSQPSAAPSPMPPSTRPVRKRKP